MPKTGSACDILPGTENKVLFCARDHFGIKPLYYYRKDKESEEIVFASEIKAFLEYPEFEKKLNKKLIGPYLSFSFTPTNETLFEGVYRLLPGTSLTAKGGKIEVKIYYDIEFEEKGYEFEELVNKISETMKDSVKHQLRLQNQTELILWDMMILDIVK